MMSDGNGNSIETGGTAEQSLVPFANNLPILRAALEQIVDFSIEEQAASWGPTDPKLHTLGRAAVAVLGRLEDFEKRTVLDPADEVRSLLDENRQTDALALIVATDSPVKQVGLLIVAVDCFFGKQDDTTGGQTVERICDIIKRPALLEGNGHHALTRHELSNRLATVLVNNGKREAASNIIKAGLPKIRDADSEHARSDHARYARALVSTATILKELDDDAWLQVLGEAEQQAMLNLTDVDMFDTFGNESRDPIEDRRNDTAETLLAVADIFIKSGDLHRATATIAQMPAEAATQRDSLRMAIIENIIHSPGIPLEQKIDTAKQWLTPADSLTSKGRLELAAIGTDELAPVTGRIVIGTEQERSSLTEEQVHLASTPELRMEGYLGIAFGAFMSDDIQNGQRLIELAIQSMLIGAETVQGMKDQFTESTVSTFAVRLIAAGAHEAAVQLVEEYSLGETYKNDEVDPLLDVLLAMHRSDNLGNALDLSVAMLSQESDKQLKSTIRFSTITIHQSDQTVFKNRYICDRLRSIASKLAEHSNTIEDTNQIFDFLEGVSPGKMNERIMLRGAYLALINKAIELGDMSLAEQYAKSAPIGSLGGDEHYLNASPHVTAVAQGYTEAGKFDETKRILNESTKKIKSSDELNPEDRFEVEMGLAEAYITSGKTEEAQKIFLTAWDSINNAVLSGVTDKRSQPSNRARIINGMAMTAGSGAAAELISSAMEKNAVTPTDSDYIYKGLIGTLIEGAGFEEAIDVVGNISNNSLRVSVARYTAKQLVLHG